MKRVINTPANDGDVTMQEIVSLAKRRGFVFPGSAIYGGLANTWDYGPLGARMLQRIRTLWWERFVDGRTDIYPVETGVIMNPKVWEASGHLQNFTDPLVECRQCQKRFRADHTEGVCPECGGALGQPRQFNLLFATNVGPVEQEGSRVYLRPETAQGMFVNIRNILTTQRPSLPFGVAQIGKAFRNEITPGNFVFRTLEFEQMEVEYFVRPQEWGQSFEAWKGEMWRWLLEIGVNEAKIRWRAHGAEELSHYSKRTEDVDFQFPFGWDELYGLAYRTDYDLRRHSEFSGEDLRWEDPVTKEKFLPHVVEPTFGLNRTLLALLVSAYRRDGDRVVLALHPSVAPYRAAVFPLVANKPELVKKARSVFAAISLRFPTAWDDRGNIGKRYYAQDEIGTPWCITVDYQTLEDDTVTVRDRDTTNQERVAIESLNEALRSAA